MKKLITFIVAILYLVTSTGATVHLHYCMGNLKSWGIGYDDSKFCSNCGMKKSDATKDCCKDDHTYIKNDNDQRIADSPSLLNGLSVAFSIPVALRMSLSYTSTTIDKYPPGDAPPLLGASLKIYIFKRAFLI
jgi:hypothetical protein